MKPLDQIRIIKCTVYTKNSHAYPEARILLVDIYEEAESISHEELFLYPGEYDGSYVEYVRLYLDSIGITCTAWGDISDNAPDFYIATENFETSISTKPKKEDADDYVIVLTSAQPVNKLLTVKTATISIKNTKNVDHIFYKHENGPDSYAELRDFYLEEAKNLVDVLFKVLPGGTIDAILCELLERKRCLLSIPLMQGNGDIDSVE